jgi:8-oxo-dGTP pyrophosphatase MutT (NUDIX family)
MRLLETINPEHVSQNEASIYPVREAARAVVTDNEGQIALLHVSRDQYYKLPGGGIETSEDSIVALRRECLEEIGCEIEVIDEIGMIVENRKFCSLKQISYCYFAKIKGHKGEPHFMEDEIEEGFEAVWVTYEKAVELLSENEAKGLEGRLYIVPRDRKFLISAQKFIKEIHS